MVIGAEMKNKEVKRIGRYVCVCVMCVGSRLTILESEFQRTQCFKLKLMCFYF